MRIGPHAPGPGPYQPLASTQLPSISRLIGEEAAFARPPVRPCRAPTGQAVMKEETSFDFNMSALRVWSLISDLRSFARWHPVYRIAGEAERGAEIDVTWLLFGGDRKMTTQ